MRNEKLSQHHDAFCIIDVGDVGAVAINRTEDDFFYIVYNLKRKPVDF